MCENAYANIPGLIWRAAFAVLVLMLAASGSTAWARTSHAEISSGVTWRDTTGAVIQAHGGSIMKVGRTFYWIGEDRGGLMPIPGSRGFETWPFKAISCYASENLITWRRMVDLLTVQQSGDIGPNRVVERPKLIYSSALRKYVLYVHLDNGAYKEARMGVAIGDTICGRFTMHSTFKPSGRDSRDFTVFEDRDGQAYIASASDENTTLRLVRLTKDRLATAAEVSMIPTSLESPAIFRRGATYFLLASKVTGWASNDNVYYTGPAISGPWTARGDFTPDSPNTYDSQVSYVLPVRGSHGTTYLFMADRWFADGGTSLSSSRYVWLPLRVRSATVHLPYVQSWRPDPARGTYVRGKSGLNCSARGMPGC